MKLDALELDAVITRNVVTKKMNEHPYLFCDENDIEESGLGPRYVTVEGLAHSITEMDAIEQACQAGGVKQLHFPVEVGQPDSRYYFVQTTAPDAVPVKAGLYRYTFECKAGDPTTYDAATNEAIW